MLKFIWKIISTIAVNVWWPFWSNIRWRKSFRNNIGIEEDDIIKSEKKLISKISDLHIALEYKADDASQLFDAINSPSQLYYDYKKNNNIKDDCDGFHALVFHILYNSKIECYLMTANAIGCGHCICLCKYNNKWHVIDYSHYEDGYDTAAEAIEMYNKIYPVRYKCKEVAYNGFVTYDYEKGRFKAISKKYLDKR